MALCRSLSLGTADLGGSLVHVAYLAAVAAGRAGRRPAHLPAAALCLGPARGLAPPAGLAGGAGEHAVPADLPLRILPPALLAARPGTFGGRGSARLIERHARAYRHAWLMLVSGVFEPLFYLLSIGVGIGALVGKVHGPGGQLIGFTSFVAPALLATSAMNGAVSTRPSTSSSGSSTPSCTTPPWPPRCAPATSRPARSAGR